MNSFKVMLEDYIDPSRKMYRRYPKASKKRRIRNKWRKRFGKTLTEIFAETIQHNYFMKLVTKDEVYNGTYFVPPSVYKQLKDSGIKGLE